MPKQPVRKQNIEDIYPLSPTQQGIWFHTLYAPDSAVYCVQLTCTIGGELNVDAFRDAWTNVVARHAILRTGFVGEARKEPAQVVQRQVDLPLAVQDWRKLSEQEQASRLDAYLQADRQAGFALNKPPLMRLALMQLADESHQLIWSHHHILLDGWCVPLLLQEVFAQYAAAANGDELQLDASRPYRDYIVWLKGQDMQVAEQFWRGELAEFSEPTRLVVDQKTVFSRTEGNTDGGELVSRITGEVKGCMTETMTADLQRLARQYGLTVNTLLQGAWSLLLSRYNASEDILFGSTVSGRPTDLPGADAMIGLFINTLPVRIRVPADAMVSEWLQDLQKQQAAIREYEYSPLTQIQRWSEVPLGQPLFESIVVFENYPVGDSLTREVAGLRIDNVRSAEETNYPLVLIAAPGPELSLRLVYDVARFDEPTIQRMMGHLQTALSGIIEGLTKDTSIRELSLLTAAEQRLILTDWTNTTTNYPRESCIHQLFEDQAAAQPDKIATIFEGQTLTYKELNEHANQLAHHLREVGVGVESPVGLCLERSLEMIIGTLAILKAGGSYLPIDPAYPADRIAFMLQDAQPQVTLCHSNTQATLKIVNRKSKIINLDNWSTIAHQPVTNLPTIATATNLAYIMYTSGSTGQPKGTSIQHRSVVRLVTETNFAQLNAQETWLQFAPISFDAATLEIWGSLLNGGKLVVAPPHTPSLEELGDLIRTEAVTSLWLTTGLFNLLVDQRLDDLKGLHQFLAGGDILSVPHARKVLAELDNCTLINGYGPTENTTFTCCYPMTELSTIGATVSIGKPIANTQVYIVDRQMQPVPIGVPGELLIGGDGVARNYFNHPALTAEKFVPNPFSHTPGATLYRTGDLVRWQADGTIEFLGRGDNQVKLRGFRIEMGEIETALIAHPAIREAVVVPWFDDVGTKRLAAYLVASQEPTPTAGELRHFLLETLPDYMVPAAFVPLASLPLGPNGKINRKALPTPGQIQTDEQVAVPRTPMEERLVDIWCQVLGVDKVGIHDSFFELGGDSILSIQVIGKAGQQGLQLTPRQLFQYPTVADLAPLVETAPVTKAQQGLVSGRVPLTPIQQWFFQQQLPEPHHFNQALLFATQEQLDPKHLEEAIQHLLLHHDALRLRFSQTDLDWQQSNAEPDDAALFSQIDLSHLPVEKRAIALEQHATQLQTSLDLGTGPLLRVALFHYGKDCGNNQADRLLFVIHHLAVDGVSWRILLEDLARIYGQLAAGQHVQLPPKTTSYQQWAKQLTTYAQMDAIQQQHAYWSATLQKPFAPLPKEFDADDQANTAGSVETVSSTVDADITRQLLHDVPSVYHTQIDDLLLAALALTVAEWTGSQTLLVNLEGHGRESIVGDDLDLSRTVGWFTAIYPAYLTVGTGADLGRTIRSIKEQLRAIPDKGLGYGLLRYLAQSNDAEGQLSHLQKPEISFNYLGQLDQGGSSHLPLALSTEPIGPGQDPAGIRPHLIDISGRIVEGQLQLDWYYSRTLHRAETVNNLAKRFVVHLGDLVAHCQAPEAGGYTPSDFALARLDQGQLDRLVGKNQQNEDIYPLSPMQEGMLLASLRSPDSGVYINQVICELGNLDVTALERAWQAVVDRHPILRTAFVWQELTEPLQVVQQQVSMPLSHEEWRDLSAAEQALRLTTFLDEDRVCGFQPDVAPLMRLTLIRLTDERYRLIWTSHHLLLDGWTTSLLLKGLLAHYEDARQQRVTELRAVRPYRDYIAWLQNQDMAAAESFWRRTLQGMTAPTPLAFDQAMSSVKSNGGGPARNEGTAKSDGHCERSLSVEATDSLRSLARRHDLTVNTILQGTWAILLAHYGSQRDVIFGTTVSGRPPDLAGAESMIGIFINTLPVRVTVGPELDMVTWLQSLQSHLSEMRQYEFSPLSQVQRWSDLPQDSPIFESIVVFENYPANVEALRDPSLSLEVHDIDSVILNNLPFTIRGVPGDQLNVEILYDTERFSETAAETVLDQITTLLALIVERPEGQVSDLLSWLADNTNAQRSLAEAESKANRGEMLRQRRRKAVGVTAKDEYVPS